MGMRPQAARWFELLMPREQLTRGLECLAASGVVELQTYSEPEGALELPGLAQALDEFGELARRFGPWWPEAKLPALDAAQQPAEAMAAALVRLRAWAREAAPVIAEVESLDVQAGELEGLAEALRAPEARIPDLARIAAAGPLLAARLYRLPPKAGLRSLPPSVITQWIGEGESVHLFAVGPVAQIEPLDRQMAAIRARRITLPDWLPAAPEAARQALAERRRAIQSRKAELMGALESLAAKHELASGLGDMVLMEWFAGHAPTLPVTEHFAWVTGWTSDPDGRAIAAAMERGKVRHLLRFKEAPPGLECPVVLHNPGWVRPFELFARLLGTPGPAEADPSRLVAVIAPLLFGFMFADVGQGAVLLAAGLLMRRRWPMFALLVPGGAMAIAFGFVFGSVFAREDLLPPLWLHPLMHPLPVLGVTLLFGIAVILLGLLLDGLQATWRRRGLHWLATRAGLVLAYLGLVGAFVQRELLWLLALGVVWFLVGSVLRSPHRLAELPKAAGELIETLLQIAVNTVSFVRVGAFALAHAGLSAAVVGMADASGSLWAALPVMLLGNVVIIALEGLVVGIQTTRLVLFEFFIRFLTAEGRPLHPLAGPATVFRTSGRKPL